MFSDTLSDMYSELIEQIDPEYSHIDIYDPEEVIMMLAQIRYVTMLSDGMKFDGTYDYSFTELREIAIHYAKRDYYRQMKIEMPEEVCVYLDPKKKFDLLKNKTEQAKKKSKQSRNKSKKSRNKSKQSRNKSLR